MITGKPKPSMHGSVSDRNNAPPTDKSDSRATLTIAIQPEKVAKWLLIIVFAIVVLGAIANIMIYNIAPSTDHPVAKFMKRFDLGHEPSLPNWYSSVALLVTSILFTIIASIERTRNSVDRARWVILAILFFILALDEAIMIHEMADKPMRDWLNKDGLLYFAWVIPYSILVFLLALFFMPFMLRLDFRTRCLLIASAIMFIVGAIGIELVEGLIVTEYGVEGGFVSMRLTIAQVIEEALEMLAVVLCIYALLDYLQRHIGALVFNIPVKPTGRKHVELDLTDEADDKH